MTGAIEAVRDAPKAIAAKFLSKRLIRGADGIRLVKEQFPAALSIKAAFDAGFLRYTYFLAERDFTIR